MPSARASHYDTLGVPPKANAEQIKHAYRQAVLKHHPDRNGGSAVAERRFKACTEAFEVLSDPAKRRQYDLEREPRRNPPRAARPPSGAEVPMDIFDHLVSVLHTVVDQTQGPACPKCNGSGSVEFRQGSLVLRSTCTTCEGRGRRSA